jgi:hypothetical protein
MQAASEMPKCPEASGWQTFWMIGPTGSTQTTMHLLIGKCDPKKWSVEIKVENLHIRAREPSLWSQMPRD